MMSMAFAFSSITFSHANKSSHSPHSCAILELWCVIYLTYAKMFGTTTPRSAEESQRRLRKYSALRSAELNEPGGFGWMFGASSRSCP